jgi:dihydroneopterin aldolase / 2-amino-4-hydroxy-6-hydroxymethyldihydropteridine diphosphokinase / dihydropteroate synthase
MQNAVTTSVHASLQDLAIYLLSAVSNTHDLNDKVVIKLVKVKPPLHCRAAGVEAQWFGGSETANNPSVTSSFIHGLTCPTLVGINDCEREEKQDVLIDITTRSNSASFLDFRAVSRAIYDVCCNFFYSFSSSRNAY